MKNNRLIRVLARHLSTSSKRGESQGGRFAGRSVIVTGGAKGIGEGCVRVFHREGAQVAILDKDVASGKLLAEQLNSMSDAKAAPRVIALQCDVTQENQLQQAIDTAVSGWGGRLDCLVNNAGWHPPPVNLEDISTQQYLHHMDINLTSTFWGCKFALPYLRNSLASQSQSQSTQQQQQQQQLPVTCSSSPSAFASSLAPASPSSSSSQSRRSLFASAFVSYPGLSASGNARKFGGLPISFSTASAFASSSSSSLSSSSSPSSMSAAPHVSFSTLSSAPAPAPLLMMMPVAPAAAPAPAPVPAAAAQSVWTATKHRQNVSIVNVSSLVGIQGQSQAVSYAAAKAGQIAITKSLAKDLGAEGIRVNCVCPSNVLTPLMNEWASSFQGGNTSAALQLVAQKQVLGRLASIEEIGNVVLFLASEDASFITGQALVVDGGATLG